MGGERLYWDRCVEEEMVLPAQKRKASAKRFPL